MAENTQNTNQNIEETPVTPGGSETWSSVPTPAQNDPLLDDLWAIPKGDSRTLLASAEWKTPGEEASERDKVSEKSKKDKSGLDLSEIVDSLKSMAGKKTEEKIDFNVQNDPTKRDKAMEEAIFERSFFNKMTKTVIAAMICIVLACGGYVFHQYLQYVQGKPVSSVVDFYMPSINNVYLKISNLLGQDPNVYSIDSLTTPSATQSLNMIISDTSLNYITKKEVLTKAVDQLIRDTVNQYSRLDSVKQDIWSHGFFPKDVQTFAASTFIDNSLQRSLIAIEAIRFSTALTYFSNLDTFLKQFSSFVSITPEQVTLILDAYKKRWEKDIQNYLTTCYFNPYVNADSCSMPQGNDFLNYYMYVDTSTTIDKNRFPVLMSYLDAKLEESDFPSLEISIQNFDPLENSISFGIELNTFQEDEWELLNKWILNPHIYLSTKIINLLRESKFIVAEPINLATLKVNKKKLRIGGEEFTISNSAFDFSLPLQKNAEREIYDFDQRQQ